MDSRVLHIVSRLFHIHASELSPDSGPTTIAAWDSAGHMNLILALEQEFGIQFGDDEVADLISIGAIIAALSRHSVKS
jgi:acyl carrier protein